MRRLWTPPEWWSEVDAETLRRDGVAGLSVAVMLVPQAMAYATLAGLPPIYGLYASLVPLLVYPFFGTAQQLAVGIVALDMVILGTGLLPFAAPGSERFVELAILTALLAGLIQIGMGLLGLGFLADLLSRPVITGFTAAAALVIAAGQLGPLLGLDLPRSEFVQEILGAAGGRLGEVHPPTALLAAASILLLLVGRRWLPRLPGPLVVVVLSTAVTWLAGLDRRGVEVTGAVPAGLPLPTLPPLDLGDAGALLSLAATLALIQLMSAISIGRALSSRHRYSVEPNRELLGLGFANAAGSFFLSPPVSASFSRSALNDDAGARTPLANVAAALVVVATLLLLTPLFAHLPQAALAAIIVVSALSLVQPKEFLLLWRVHRRDGAMALLTIAATLVLGIQEGVLVGIAGSTLVVLYRFSRPNVSELGHVPGTTFFRDRARFPSAEPVPGLLVVRVDAAFSFFNAAFFRKSVLRRSEEGPGNDGGVRAVILEARGINDVDTTAIHALRELVGTLRARGVQLHLAGLQGKVRDVLHRAGVREYLDQSHFHLSSHHAVRKVLEAWDAEDGGDRAVRYVERSGGPGGREAGVPLT